MGNWLAQIVFAFSHRLPGLLDAASRINADDIQNSTEPGR